MKTLSLDEASRLALARSYANGEISIRELRRAGHWRMIELLSDQAALGLRLPLADMGGPNAQSRRAGIERLGAVLRG